MSDLYDEFGTYIGPPIEDESEDEIESDDEARLSDVEGLPQDEPMDGSSAIHSAKVLPHEEIMPYPTAKEIYGQDVETRVEEEDNMPITEPILAPMETKTFDIQEKALPDMTFTPEYMSFLMGEPQFVRNIALIGHLHHGKTSFMEMILNNVMDIHGGNISKNKKEVRYTDTRTDEQEKGLSIKATPMSLVLPSSSSKSYLFNIIDTPGHPNFLGEVTAAMRLCDGAVFVVDALDGVMVPLERQIRAAVRDRLDIVLVVNGIDRIILALRLPPADAYLKLRHTIEEFNKVVQDEASLLGRIVPQISPVEGNVAFSSATFKGIFTLKSFAELYAQHFDFCFDPEAFTRVLWGDTFFDPEKRNFSLTPVEEDGVRSFVKFILEPLYKITVHTVAEEKPSLEPTLKEVGVCLRGDDFKRNTRDLLEIVWPLFLGDCSSFVDMVVKCVSDPRAGGVRKVEMIYAGDQNGIVAESMKNLDKNGPLVLHTTKCYHKQDCQSFDVFGRVFSGTVAVGQKVKVLGEAYRLDDDEDSTSRIITNLWIPEARFRFEISHVTAGNLVLIGGVDPSIRKTSTIIDAATPPEMEIQICRPLNFYSEAVIKVATEPLNPSELPKMLEGLRKLEKSYPIVRTYVEESGEHTLFGTGEIQLDCMLHDLRNLYGDLEIKVSDPCVKFCETVSETASMRSFATSANQQNKIFMLAEPLDKRIGQDVENGHVSINWERKKLAKHFTEKYDWDILAARNIWAFGPDDVGPNVLIDDSLPTHTDKKALGTVKQGIIQGFHWATREGPLIEEQMRNVRFRILDAEVSGDPVAKGSGQIIPTARRVAYSSFLLSTPKLMEPMLFAEISCPADCVAAVYTVLNRRRGHVSKDAPKPGTPLYVVHAYIPAIESFGFETDIRSHTSGQAFGLTFFDSWNVVPGDPMDKSILLRPLEPAPAPHLAREFLLKTRRRKGLSEDVAVAKFFDPEILEKIMEEL